MHTDIEEKIKSDVRSGKEERVIRSYIQGLRLSSELEQVYFNILDDQIAIHQLRQVKVQDAKLLVYLGYVMMGLAIFFGMYNMYFGVAIFVVGILVKRRGDRQVADANQIDSIKELLRDEPTKFHKRKI